MWIQVLKAGKDRSWSLLKSEVRCTGTSGLEFGRAKVDIAANAGFEDIGGEDLMI